MHVHLDRSREAPRAHPRARACRDERPPARARHQALQNPEASCRRASKTIGGKVMWWSKPKPKAEPVPPVIVMVRSAISDEGPATYSATHISTNPRGELWIDRNGLSVAVYAPSTWISAGTVATAKDIDALREELSAAKERLDTAAGK